MTTTYAKINRYPANCVRCGNRVEAEQGLLAKTAAGKWAADHPADCPAAAAKPAAATIAVVTAAEGMYLRDGVVFKVQVAKNGSGHRYAKRLVIAPGEDKGSFVYAPGAIKTLTADDAMTAEQAANFGALYGACSCCGRTLTDETSIAAGIGPICAKKHFPTATFAAPVIKDERQLIF